ncbi:MAG: hypothetical protein KBT12_02590 [Bacteroidales bacterium]|nr:hypothetical protein [Candidatus Physcousia equi]
MNNLCGVLLAECIANRHYSPSQADDIENIMLTIACMQDDLVCRISHPEPGMKAGAFFRHLNDDMRKQTNDIVDQLAQLS